MKRPEKRKIIKSTSSYCDEFLDGQDIGFNKAWDKWFKFLPSKDEIKEIIKTELKKQIFPPNWDKLPKAISETKSNADFSFENVKVEIFLEPIAIEIVKRLRGEK